MDMNALKIFTTSLSQVLIMLCYGLPGFILVKLKKIDKTHILSFNHILMFICQPFMILYAFKSSKYDPNLNFTLFLFGTITFLLQIFVILSIYLIVRKKAKEMAKYRIISVASAFGNVGFFGIPLIQVILPENPNAILFAVVYLLGMNILAWTLVSAILTNDKKHFNILKFLFNPATLPLIIALPMWYTNTKYPLVIDKGVDILGQMATVVSMLIIGMRLAVTPKELLFKNFNVLITIIIKQILFPLLMLGVAYCFLPIINKDSVIIMYILACAPCASLVLNFSEHYKEGSEIAAPTVLLSTISSVITIPIMLLIIPLIFS